MPSNLTLPKKGLRIAHLNICSLRNKVQDISQIILEHSLHILAISETHLGPSINSSLLNIDGYNIYRKDRNENGGGVAIYIQSHIPVRMRDDLSVLGVEVLWLQFQLPHLKPVLIGCCYRPPDSSIMYLDQMCEMLDRACDLDKEIYFVGDININWDVKSCALRSKLLSCANTCNLTQVVTKPTRICHKADGSKSSTCIDLIFTNVAELCSKALSIPVGCSDHNIVAIGRKTKVPKSGQKIVLKRMFKYFNENNYYEEVKNIDWSTVLQEEDPNTALNVFNKLLMPIIDKHAPLKKRTVRNVSSPWLDQELRHYMAQRNEAKVQAIKSGDTQQWDLYRKLRNFVTKLNKIKKNNYYKNRIENAKLDSRKIWNTLNELMGKKANQIPSFLETEGNILTKPLDIANYLGDYFKNKIKKLRDDMADTDKVDISSELINDKIMKDKLCRFCFVNISIDRIQKYLSNSPEKSSGVDNLEIQLLKPVSDLIAVPIAYIMNLSLSKGKCPVEWKTAKIIPLAKNTKEPFSGKNSRPISLLPALSKIMEKIVYEQIQEYFSKNNLNTVYQHAYRKGHSTTTALTQMADDWMTEIDKKRIIGAVLLDLSAAFDVLDHTLLLNKLSCYGFEASAIEWIKSYLTDRKYTVYFNGSYSGLMPVSCGVPQGSSLGPLLFSIFLNDLPLILNHATVAIYADDSTIYTSSNTSSELERVLNGELRVIERWMRLNKLVLNKEKTKCIVLGSNYSLRCLPTLHLKMGDSEIEQVNEVKLLGITVDDKLSWNKQIDQIVKKMGRSMGAIKHCRRHLPTFLIKQLVQALVISQIDYCSMIWSNTTESNLNRLQVAQNKAARLVLQCSYRTSVSTMNNELAWLSVKGRLHYSLLCFTKNIITSKAPEIIYKNLLLFSDIHHYDTRQSSEGRYLLPACSTKVKQKTFYYRAMVAWNSLPVFLLDMNSASFKKRLKLYLFMQEL